MTIEQVIDRFARGRPLNGTVYLNIEGEVYEKHYGYACIDSKQPIQSTTLFPVASVTKQFTAASTLKALDQAGFSTAMRVAEITDLAPEFPNNTTVHQLLSHTVGQSFSYSNAGYHLLEKIVVELSGNPLDAFMEKHIFAPLGMQSSQLVPRCLPEKAANGHSFNDDTPAAKLRALDEQPKFDQIRGSGAIITSATDLSIWNLALHHGRVLRAGFCAGRGEACAQAPLSHGG